jgi:uncharacterized protein YtpQ (UPF0354 family)
LVKNTSNKQARRANIMNTAIVAEYLKDAEVELAEYYRIGGNDGYLEGKVAAAAEILLLISNSEAVNWHECIDPIKCDH